MVEPAVVGRPKDRKTGLEFQPPLTLQPPLRFSNEGCNNFYRSQRSEVITPNPIPKSMSKMEGQGKKPSLTRLQRDVLAAVIDDAEDRVVATKREMNEEVHQLIKISRHQQARLEVRADIMTRKMNDATANTLDQISTLRKSLQRWGLTEDDEEDIEPGQRKELLRSVLTLGFRASEIEVAGLDETVDLTGDSTNDSTCTQASASPPSAEGEAEREMVTRRLVVREDGEGMVDPDGEGEPMALGAVGGEGERKEANNNKTPITMRARAHLNTPEDWS